MAAIRDIAQLAEQAGLKVALYPRTWFWLERVQDAVRVTEFLRGPAGKHTVHSAFAVDKGTVLPRVDIVMAHETMDGALIDAAVTAGAKGIIIAGVGNGNMTQGAIAALAVQSKKGNRLRALLPGYHRPRRA